ncbi:MAG: hypothetical protein Q7U39_01125 [Nitrospira sp.]|nr:hypothetical protein [Nitrospira sp.]
MRKLKTKTSFQSAIAEEDRRLLACRKLLHVRGFKEEGTTSTPFDMVVMNDLDRFHLVADVIDRVPALGPRAANAKQAIRDKLIEHKQYIAKHDQDLPEIRNGKWSAGSRKGSASCHG